MIYLTDILRDIIISTVLTMININYEFLIEFLLTKYQMKVSE